MKPRQSCIWTAYAKAQGRWDEVKLRAWQAAGHDPSRRFHCDDVTYRHMCQALAQIGRHGYKATAGMELLELYCPFELVEEAAEKATIIQRIRMRLVRNKKPHKAI